MSMVRSSDNFSDCTIKSRMSSKFDQIRPWSAELAALECLKKSSTYLRKNYFKYFYDMLALR